MEGDRNSQKAKIVIIDDEQELALTIKKFLEKRDFSVSCAYDGKSGWELVKKEVPDIVILDVTMPEMDGRDVLIALKKDRGLKNIPVIMLTAKDDQFDRDYGIELGAYEYITKPYESHILLRQVSRILDKKEKGEL